MNCLRTFPVYLFVWMFVVCNIQEVPHVNYCNYLLESDIGLQMYLIALITLSGLFLCIATLYLTVVCLYNHMYLCTCTCTCTQVCSCTCRVTCVM